MTKYRIRQSLPSKDELLDLLNEAYDGWGGNDQFEWKYNSYPGYDENQCYHIKINGELAAFRRLFNKKIKSNSGTEHEFFVLGDTCVAPPYQGQGLYSRLHGRTTEDCKARGTNLCATFNRSTNISFKANRKRGWMWRRLPVKLRVLSPDIVVPDYAPLALEGSKFANRLLPHVPTRVYDLLSAKGVAMAVELASSDVGIWSQTRRVGQIPSSKRNRELSISVLSEDGAKERISEIQTLYSKVVGSYDFHFSRDVEHITHMLKNPNLKGVVTVETDGLLLGFAPIVVDAVSGIREARVLDLVTDGRLAARHAAAGIEQAAKDAGADLIVALSDVDLGPYWSQVDKQVFMWNSFDPDTRLLQQRSLFVGLYDAV